MYRIEWLKGLTIVERELNDSTDVEDLVSRVKSRAREMRMRHPKDAPDRFRILDESHKEIRIVGIELTPRGTRF